MNKSIMLQVETDIDNEDLERLAFWTMVLSKVEPRLFPLQVSVHAVTPEDLGEGEDAG